MKLWPFENHQFCHIIVVHSPLIYSWLNVFLISYLWNRHVLVNIGCWKEKMWEKYECHSVVSESGKGSKILQMYYKCTNDITKVTHQGHWKPHPTTMRIWCRRKFLASHKTSLLLPFAAWCLFLLPATAWLPVTVAAAAVSLLSYSQFSKAKHAQLSLTLLSFTATQPPPWPKILTGFIND